MWHRINPNMQHVTFWYVWLSVLIYMHLVVKTLSHVNIHLSIGVTISRIAILSWWGQTWLPIIIASNSQRLFNSIEFLPASGADGVDGLHRVYVVSQLHLLWGGHCWSQVRREWRAEAHDTTITVCGVVERDMVGVPLMWVVCCVVTKDIILHYIYIYTYTHIYNTHTHSCLTIYISLIHISLHKQVYAGVTSQQQRPHHTGSADPLQSTLGLPDGSQSSTSSQSDFFHTARDWRQWEQ